MKAWRGPAVVMVVVASPARPPPSRVRIDPGVDSLSKMAAPLPGVYGSPGRTRVFPYLSAKDSQTLQFRPKENGKL